MQSNDPNDDMLGVVLQSAVPDNVNHRLHLQLAEFRERLADRPQPQAAWLVGSRKRMWLGIATGAAAAVVLAGVFGFLLRPQVSFADVVAAVQRLPWVQVSVTEPDGDTREVWYSAKEDVSASRSKDWIEYHDHKLRVYESYDVAKDVLYRVPEYTPRRLNKYATIVDTLQVLLQGERPVDKPLDRLEFLGKRGAALELQDQSLQRVTVGGREWLDYRLTIRYSTMPEPVHFLFRVDAKTMLPQLCRVEGKWDEKPAVSEQRFSYPERGPANAYDVGVPKSAKLVDRIPPKDIERMLDTIRAGRQRMDDYRAIVVGRMDDPKYLWWLNEWPMIFYRKGDKFRVDRASWLGKFPKVNKPAENADMEKWWRERARGFVYSPLYISDNSSTYSIKSHVVVGQDGSSQTVVESVDKRVGNSQPGEAFPPYWSRTPEFVCRPPLGIPSQAFEPALDAAPAEGPAGSVLLRVRRTGGVPKAVNPNPDQLPPEPDMYRFWLDSNKGYAVLRYDLLGGADAGQDEILSSTVIEQLEKSPRGIWYAARFRVKAVPPVEHDEVFDVYIDFDVELPDTLFEPPATGRLMP